MASILKSLEKRNMLCEHEVFIALGLLEHLSILLVVL